MKIIVADKYKYNKSFAKLMYQYNEKNCAQSHLLLQKWELPDIFNDFVKRITDSHNTRRIETLQFTLQEELSNSGAKKYDATEIWARASLQKNINSLCHLHSPI